MSDEAFDFNPSMVVCSKCSGIMRYKGGGAYACEDCGAEVLDDYGKVREFLDKRGPSNVMEIAAGTGLERSVVSKLLKDGRLEVSQHSSTQLFCRRCGMGIRYGEYCSRCQNEVEELHQRNIKKGVYNAIQEQTSEGSTKMRFLNNDKNDKKK